MENPSGNPEWYSLAPDYPNHELNLSGEVRNAKTRYILKPFADRYGYLRLSIGNIDNVYVHILVCTRFVSGYQYGFEVNHIDGVKTNNHYSNLEWVSKSDNIKHAVRLGLQNPNIGLAAAVEANKKRVRLVEDDLVFDSIVDCAEYLGVFPQNVQRVLRGERERIHGYHVEYVI